MLCKLRERESSRRRVPNFTPSFAGRAERETGPRLTQKQQQRLARGLAVQELPHGVPSGAPRTLMGATSCDRPYALWESVMGTSSVSVEGLATAVSPAPSS